MISINYSHPLTMYMFSFHHIYCYDFFLSYLLLVFPFNLNLIFKCNYTIFFSKKIIFVIKIFYCDEVVVELDVLEPLVIVLSVEELLGFTYINKSISKGNIYNITCSKRKSNISVIFGLLRRTSCINSRSTI